MYDSLVLYVSLENEDSYLYYMFNYDEKVMNLYILLLVYYFYIYKV